MAKLRCVRGHVEDIFLRDDEEPGRWYREGWMSCGGTAEGARLALPFVEAYSRCLSTDRIDRDDIVKILGAISADGGRIGEQSLEAIERVHDLDLLSLEFPEIVPILEDVRSQRTIVPRRYWRAGEIVSPSFHNRIALGITYGGEEHRPVPCDDGGEDD